MSERLPTATAIARAAAVRAGGGSWQAAADEVGKAVTTVKCYPSKHRDLWRQEYLAAHEAVVDVARDAAIACLVASMDDDRPDIRLRAADAIWSNSIRERPPTQRVEGALTFEVIMPHREAPDGG